MHQNLHSTKPHAPLDLAPNLLDANAFPLAIENGKCTHLCYAAMMELTGQTYMDLTGKFVSPSSSGNNYILIIYDYYSNKILAVPLPNHCSDSIFTVYQTMHAQLCAAELHPHLQHLDNEASQVLKDFLVAEDVDFQFLVPPHVHCHNAAEHAIHTFKTILLLAFAAPAKTFLSTSGTASSPRLN